MQFKNKKEIEKYFEGDKIECLICGKQFKALGTHLLHKHNMEVDEYKKEFGLPWGRGLTSNMTKQKQSMILKDRLETDHRMVMTQEIMHKGQQASKRQMPKFAKKESSKRCLIMTDKKKKETIKNANKIIDMMEKEGLPACYACLFDDLPGIHTLTGATKYDKITKERYLKVKKQIPSMVELKTGLKKNALVKQIKNMRAEGMIFEDIANYFNIDKKTVINYVN